MLLIFRGGNEFVKMHIDRKTKKLSVASSRTNYDITPTPWKNLFDKGKEQLQERITDRMNDVEFRSTIIRQMAQYGYKIVKSD